jgi:hypothetical protein
MITKEKGKGADNVAVAQKASIKDLATHKTRWFIARFASEADKLAGKVYSKAEALKLFGAGQFSSVDGNVLLNGGINNLLTLAAGTGGTKYDNATAHIGVGDSSTAAAASQTGLQAATNKAYAAMMASFPTYGTSQKATWKASFDGNTGNFAWEEFIVCTSNAGANALNRKCSSQGTKTSGQVWEITLEITLS